ncbi:MAG: hypothetical protein AB7T31_16650 [Gemmatimonadales bacterium]
MGPSLLILAAAYFLPTIVAFGRWSAPFRGKKVLLFGIFNFFVAWTGIGWLACLIAAFSKRLEEYLGRMAAASAGVAGYATPPAGTLQPPSWETVREPARCSACGGAGEQPCPQCSGRGSWYQPPQTASGVAQLVTCSYCTSSGRIRCQSCGGSGRFA